MLRWIFVSLQSLRGFERELRKRILFDTEDELLKRCLNKAKRAGRADVAEVCEFLTHERPKFFKEILQFNRAEGDTNARRLCDWYEAASFSDTSQLLDELNEMLIRSRSLCADRIHVLLDLPMVFGSMKLGEDLKIETYRGDLLAASQLSGVIKGAQRGFSEHIQRLRIFLHPTTYTELFPVLPEVIQDVQQFLFEKS